MVKLVKRCALIFMPFFFRENSFPIMESSMASMSSYMFENDISSTGMGETQSHRMLGNDVGTLPKTSKLQGYFPSSTNGYSLEILAHPEEQHRARYLTEGSRGPVKDRTQQGFPQIQVSFV